MEAPKPIANQNPAIKEFLQPIAEEIADSTKTKSRHPLQHSECPFVAGTVQCLEAGGRMCTACGWWDMVCGEDDGE